ATITEKKRRSWNALEKLAIVLYQEKVCSVRSAASKFNIEPKQIRDWRAKKEMLMQARPHVKLDGKQSSLNLLSLGVICVYHKWVDGDDTSNRRRTTISQKLPEDLVEKQHEFLSFILYQRNLTIDECGARTVNIRTTGHERSHFTVVLACMADGTKLPPVIIFKLENVPRANFPADVFVRANSNGWMDETEMRWWIDCIWSKRCPFSNPRSLLVMDSFSAHITTS
ncbi:5311_t:CDS:2, partial [Paraglomus occultum]